MHASIIPKEEAKEMPSESEFHNAMVKFANFKKEDPTPHYSIVSKIGQGGFAKVFKAKKVEDGSFVALKLIEIEEDDDRFATATTIEHEVGLMNLCQSQTDSILKVVDCFDYMERKWIFVELMSDNLYHFIKEMHDSKLYTENVIAYILR